MKSKYKLGTLIQYVRVSACETGIICGIIYRKEGVSYEVESHDINNKSACIQEIDVIAAYKPVKASGTVKRFRKPKLKEKAA